MYSIPQHAVTNGYWKIENFRAHPMASPSRLAKTPAPPDISLPIEGAIVPGVEEPHHQDPEKNRHPRQAPRAQVSKDDGPGVEENELHVEQDEQDRGQVELDRQVAGGHGERGASALERLRFHLRRLFRAGNRGPPHEPAGDRPRKREEHENPHVFTHKATTAVPSRL